MIRRMDADKTWCLLLLIALLGAGCPSEDDEENNTVIDLRDQGGETTSADMTVQEDMAREDMSAQPDMSSTEDQGMDMPGQEDMGMPPQVEWPDGEPAAGELYVKGECLTENYCQNDTSAFDSFHRGSLTTCSFDGSVLELKTAEIENSATSFTLKFPIADSPTIELSGPSTEVDWSYKDGASAFFFWPVKQGFEGVDQMSSGTITLAQCGAEISGVFTLEGLAEYHSVTFDPWIVNAQGAFRCQPTQAVDCGL